MNLFCIIVFVLVLIIGFLFMFVLVDVVQENVSGDLMYIVEVFFVYVMIGDLFIVCFFLIVVMVVGVVVFVVSLLFIVVSGSVGKVGQVLVVDLGKEVFVCCLGCIISGYNYDES